MIFCSGLLNCFPWRLTRTRVMSRMHNCNLSIMINIFLERQIQNICYYIYLCGKVNSHFWKEVELYVILLNLWKGSESSSYQCLVFIWILDTFPRNFLPMHSTYFTFTVHDNYYVWGTILVNIVLYPLWSCPWKNTIPCCLQMRPIRNEEKGLGPERNGLVVL